MLFIITASSKVYPEIPRVDIVYGMRLSCIVYRELRRVNIGGALPFLRPF